MMILNPVAGENGYHCYHEQPWRGEEAEPWNAGWLRVPPEWRQAVRDCVGRCVPEITEGVITGIAPLPPLPEPEPEAGADELLQLLLGGSMYE